MCGLICLMVGCLHFPAIKSRPPPATAVSTAADRMIFATACSIKSNSLSPKKAAKVLSLSSKSSKLWPFKSLERTRGHSRQRFVCKMAWLSNSPLALSASPVLPGATPAAVDGYPFALPSPGREGCREAAPTPSAAPICTTPSPLLRRRGARGEGPLPSPMRRKRGLLAGPTL